MSKSIATEVNYRVEELYSDNIGTVLEKNPDSTILVDWDDSCRKAVVAESVASLNQNPSEYGEL